MYKNEAAYRMLSKMQKEAYEEEFIALAEIFVEMKAEQVEKEANQAKKEANQAKKEAKQAQKEANKKNAMVKKMELENGHLLHMKNMMSMINENILLN